MLTASAQALRFIVTLAAAQGTPPLSLFAALGVDPAVVIDPDGRLPLDLLLRAWITAAELTGNPDFGLFAAQQVRISDFGALGYVIRHSPSLGAAYRRFSRYVGMVNQAVELSIIDQGESVSLRVKMRSPVADLQILRQPVDCLLGVLMECARRFGGARVAAHAVRFRHPEPTQTTAYLRIFEVLPSFSQPVDELVLPRAVLDLPNRQADPLLLPILEEHLEKRADTTGRSGADLDRVRCVLRQLLQQGEPTAAQTAQLLHMSPRTLQRRLHQQGTSVKLLVEEVRRELALQQVQGSSMPLAEIAFVLGFSDVSAFHRAFKRWTGQTPTELRKQSAEARDSHAIDRTRQKD